MAWAAAWALPEESAEAIAWAAADASLLFKALTALASALAVTGRHTTCHDFGSSDSSNGGRGQPCMPDSKLFPLNRHAHLTESTVKLLGAAAINSSIARECRES
jgi:hypothetical protein